MSIQKYEAFLKVVDERSISRAATEMGYTQSAVSKMLKELETEWGVRLVIRNHDGIEITAEGKELLEEVRRLVRDSESLSSTVASLHGVNKGTIRLGAPVSVSTNFLPKVLKEFHTSYPHIRVDLYEGEDVEIADLMRRGVVDVCILPKPYSEKYLSTTLFTDSLVAVLPSDHPMAAAEVFPISEFETEEVICFREVGDYDLKRFFDDNDIEPNIIYEVSDDYIMISMVESGLGVCVDYELVLKPLRYNVAVKHMDRTKQRTLELCVRDETSRTPLIELFTEYVIGSADRFWNSISGSDRGT